jgi:protein-S-isoprenylcysteine O-methyltransferase Ste14
MKEVIILSLAVIIYTLVHSLLASFGVKDWTRRVIGPVADRWYRLAYNLFAGISGLPILALLFILPDRRIYQIPFPWLLLTGAGQLFGILIIIVGIWQTDLWHFVGLRQIITGEASDTQPLVITGLYRWMRHPLYTGGLLLIWLVPTMTLNLLTVFIWLTIYLIVGAFLEEKRLIHQFGDDYREYQKHVPMLLPSPRRKL